MKRNIYVYLLLLIGITLASCKKSDITNEDDYNKSHQSWVSFKASSNNSYRYTVNTTSWIGTSSETKITMKNNKAVHRSFTASAIDRDTHKSAVYLTWEEDESNINTHAGAATALSLDEIYQKAKSEWLLKRADAKTYFETANNGMISSAGYQENNCADDCFVGIHISAIEKIANLL